VSFGVGSQVGENGETLEDSVEVASGVSFKDELMALAKDYIRMSIAKLRVYKLPESFKPEEELSKTILVIGGGVAGLTAALECAKAWLSCSSCGERKGAWRFCGKA
jgi:quinone-modifying oxidoreductase subunit QmoB